MRARPHPLRLQVDSRHLAGCPCLVFKNERNGRRAGRDGKEKWKSGEREDKKAQEQPESSLTTTTTAAAAAVAVATKKRRTSSPRKHCQ